MKIRTTPEILISRRARLLTERDKLDARIERINTELDRQQPASQLASVPASQLPASQLPACGHIGCAGHQ